jgi:glycine/D-amino acid oxidase-like deaminating enzyme
VSADVAIVGGGYLGMWTAWHLLEREPNARIVLLERDRCGFGPSGRNGGFVNGYEDKLEVVTERFGAAAGRRLIDAAANAVTAIGEFCEREGVDAWYRSEAHVEIATNAAQDGPWASMTPAEVVRHARSPRFRGGLAIPGATVHPARLAFGLRDRLLARGVRIFEHSRVTRIAGTSVTTDGGQVDAPSVVVAVNHVAGGLRPFRRKVSTASSHIVLTAPIPDKLEEIGWTDGSALADHRTMLHYFRTTNDGRIVFGWGGGRMGYGTRRRRALDVDPGVSAHDEAMLRRFFPQLEGVPIEHRWGGPIDVSPIRLPQYHQDGRVVAGFGFTGNGVGPTYLGGQILSGMALDARDELTSLPLVNPDVPRFPPEPLRFIGGSLIRAAMVRADEDADQGRPSSPPVRFFAGLPRRLGMSLPR